MKMWKMCVTHTNAPPSGCTRCLKLAAKAALSWGWQAA